MSKVSSGKCIPAKWYGIRVMLDPGETIDDATRLVLADPPPPAAGFYHESIRFKIVSDKQVNVEFHDVQLPTVASPEVPSESVQ